VLVPVLVLARASDLALPTIPRRASDRRRGQDEASDRATAPPPWLSVLAQESTDSSLHPSEQEQELEETADTRDSTLKTHTNSDNNSNNSNNSNI
jgi:hypothetical protein